MLLGPLLYFALGAHVPFHRVMDRALLISSVLAVLVSLPWAEVARFWPLSARSGWEIAGGFLLAFISSQTILAFDLGINGFVRASLSAGQVAGIVSTALVAALLVPPLEETIFRGFLVGQLAQLMSRRAACLLGALIFMLAHFLKIPVSLDREPVHLWSGVGALGAAFHPVLQGDCLSWKGLNLFLIGVILGGIFLRSGRLWLSAGLHAGWILVLLLFAGLTRPSPHPAHPELSGDMLSNPLASLVLSVLGLWLWRYYPPRSTAPVANGPNAS